MSSSPDTPSLPPPFDSVQIGSFRPYSNLDTVQLSTVTFENDSIGFIWRYTEPDGSFVYKLDPGLEDDTTVPDPETAARVLFLLNLVLTTLGDPPSLINALQRFP